MVNSAHQSASNEKETNWKMLYHNVAPKKTWKGIDEHHKYEDFSFIIILIAKPNENIFIFVQENNENISSTVKAKKSIKCSWTGANSSSSTLNTHQTLGLH